MEKSNMLIINVDQEDEDRRLSFSDLPIYNNATEWEKYYSSESQSLNSSQEEGFFEFFNEEWSKNPFFDHHDQHQDIIFCGKFIPQEKPTSDNISPKNLKNKSKRSEKKRGIFSRDYITFFQGKGSRSWYLLLFGISRRPQEVKLSDLKSRQSRKVSPFMSPSSLIKGRCNKGKGKGLWWLIKTLSCSDNSYHAQAVVKASISYNSQV